LDSVTVDFPFVVSYGKFDGDAMGTKWPGGMGYMNDT
jgi:hypothetical protein